MVRELAADPYVPLIGTLPAHADDEQALAWIERQHQRWDDAAGFSFAIADADDDRALGQVGLWLVDVENGRASAGYCVTPGARGRGLAAAALRGVTAFGWTIDPIDRIELEIEPANTASLRTAQHAGYLPVGTSEREIGGTQREMQVWRCDRPS